MQHAVSDWRAAAREGAITRFRQAWGLAPPAGREALIQAAERNRIGHRWETGRRACVLALLVRPALRPGERPKAGAYRLFGCDVVDDFPATWDGAGVTAPQLLAAVGVHLPPSPSASLIGRTLQAIGVRRVAHAG